MTAFEKLTRQQWLILAAAFLGWMFDGVELGLFPLASRPALRSLMHAATDRDVGPWIGTIGACFLLGAACGGVIFGWFGDKFGRVRGMVLAILAFSLFTGAGYFATQPWHLGAFAFMAALGMGGEWALAVALVMECWPERHRPKLAGAIGAASNFGFLTIALVAWNKPVTIDSWRWLMLVGASPAVLALMIAGFIPESERWKASVRPGASQPLVEIFRPQLRRMTIFGILLAGIPLIGTWAAVSGWIPSWVEKLKEAEVTQQYLAQAQPGPVPVAASAEIKPNTDYVLTREQQADVTRMSARAKAMIQIVLSIGAIIGGSLAPLIANEVGRRPSYFGLCLLSMISCGMLFRTSHTVDVCFILTTGVVGAVTAAFYGWLPLYLPEIFPTRVRATGQGLCYNSGRILAAVGTLQMGKLVEVLGGNYATAGATITLIYVVGMAVIWFAPETKGQPLPE